MEVCVGIEGKDRNFVNEPRAVSPGAGYRIVMRASVYALSLSYRDKRVIRQ